ncbi:hypothetical protein [Trabulsiella guamensis]|uniref:hypothetical protein n=1 Tax=Trabulsiella guamensis TaxID=158852 RepID=UPI0012EC97A1|nr:hypothetical protein [Trabulsiella guamensis]
MSCIGEKLFDRLYGRGNILDAFMFSMNSSEILVHCFPVFTSPAPVQIWTKAFEVNGDFWRRAAAVSEGYNLITQESFNGVRNAVELVNSVPEKSQSTGQHCEKYADSCPDMNNKEMVVVEKTSKLSHQETLCIHAVARLLRNNENVNNLTVYICFLTESEERRSIIILRFNENFLDYVVNFSGRDQIIRSVDRSSVTPEDLKILTVISGDVPGTQQTSQSVADQFRQTDWASYQCRKGLLQGYAVPVMATGTMD